MGKSIVRRLAIATPEWHFYCPFCERSNLSRMRSLKKELNEKRVVTCSDCGEKYHILNDMEIHNKQPRYIRIET